MAISTQPYRTAIAVAAAALAAGLLVPIQVKVSRPMLLAERFVPGGGWAEIALLTLYAGWVAWAMADPKRQAKVRRRVWAAFSIASVTSVALVTSYLRLVAGSRFALLWAGARSSSTWCSSRWPSSWRATPA